MTPEAIKKAVDHYFDAVRGYRRHIHQHPELSFQEHETASFIERTLTNLNFLRVCETGLMATVFAPGQNENATCLALRADIDALPIKEETNLEFASQNSGVMHACGHDMHSAILMGVAHVVTENQHLLKKSVKFVFQLGEEKLPGGASMMIQQGVLENPKVDEMYGLHVFPDLTTGLVGFRSGKYMASCDEIYITIHGKGGHAALPHTVIDPIYIGSQLIVQAQGIVSRYANPTVPSVLSFGHFEGIGATNIIPNTVQIKGTFRTMDEAWRAKAHGLLEKLVQELAMAHGAKIDLEIDKGYPFLVNDETVTENARKLVSCQLGNDNIVDLDLRMTAEDFSYYSQQVPATFFRIGVRSPNESNMFGLHNSRFNPDEDAIRIGMEAMLAIVFG
jgi:amidohydrolase